MSSGTACSRRRFLAGRAAKEPQTAGVAIAGACLARRGVICQSCADVCPERAIRFNLQRGGPPLPVVDEASCTGCGACVEICPADAVAWRQDQEEHAP